mmetsp:Transcript_777/g.2110  ORF Transcript_777/g.2110 Transcript_777/m.2110 type:complete len:218 (-) Transcript_777:113-766(-)
MQDDVGQPSCQGRSLVGVDWIPDPGALGVHVSLHRADAQLDRGYPALTLCLGRRSRHRRRHAALQGGRTALHINAAVVVATPCCDDRAALCIHGVASEDADGPLWLSLDAHQAHRGVQCVPSQNGPVNDDVLAVVHTTEALTAEEPGLARARLVERTHTPPEDGPLHRPDEDRMCHDATTLHATAVEVRRLAVLSRSAPCGVQETGQVVTLTDSRSV